MYHCVPTSLTFPHMIVIIRNGVAHKSDINKKEKNIIPFVMVEISFQNWVLNLNIGHKYLFLRIIDFFIEIIRLQNYAGKGSADMGEDGGSKKIINK